jgi:hypothetical protein
MTMERGVFSLKYVQSGYNEDGWGDPVSCQLSSAQEAVKIGPEHGKLKNLYC